MIAATVNECQGRLPNHTQNEAFANLLIELNSGLVFVRVL